MNTNARRLRANGPGRAVGLEQLENQIVRRHRGRRNRRRTSGTRRGPRPQHVTGDVRAEGASAPPKGANRYGAALFSRCRIARSDWHRHDVRADVHHRDVEQDRETKLAGVSASRRCRRRAERDPRSDPEIRPDEIRVVDVERAAAQGSASGWDGEVGGREIAVHLRTRGDPRRGRRAGHRRAVRGSQDPRETPDSLS